MASVAPDASASGRDSPSVTTLATDSLAVGIAFFAIASVLQRLVGFGRSLVFCHLMSDEELGRWSLSFSFLMMAAPFAVLGLPGCFGRYFEYYRMHGQARRFLRRILWPTALLTIIFATVVLTVPGTVSLLLLGTAEHAALVRGLALALVLVVALNVTTELAIAMRQVRLVSIVQFIHSILFAIFACGLLATTSLADQGVVVGYSVSGLIASGLAIWFLVGKVKTLAPDTERLDSQRLDSDRCDRSFWSRLLPFAAWLWVSNTLFNLFDTADRLMIVHFAQGHVSTDALVGQYHSSRVVPTLLVAVSGMLAGVILPYLSEYWERGDRAKASRTTLLTLKVCTLLYVFGGAVVLTLAPLLFGTLLQGRYDAGLQILPGTLVYCIWFGLTILTESHLLCAEQARSTSLALILGLVVNIVLNAILLPWLGLVGAVTATAIANAIALCVTLRLAKSWGLQLDRQTVALTALPIVLLLGSQWTLAVLLAIAWLVIRGGLIFDAAERGVLATAWTRLADRVPRPRWH
jgi:PST family polysaccharide transporter